MTDKAQDAMSQLELARSAGQHVLDGLSAATLPYKAEQSQIEAAKEWYDASWPSLASGKDINSMISLMPGAAMAYREIDRYSRRPTTETAHESDGKGKGKASATSTEVAEKRHALSLCCEVLQRGHQAWVGGTVPEVLPSAGSSSRLTPKISVAKSNADLLTLPALFTFLLKGYRSALSEYDQQAVDRDSLPLSATWGFRYHDLVGDMKSADKAALTALRDAEILPLDHEVAKVSLEEYLEAQQDEMIQSEDVEARRALGEVQDFLVKLDQYTQYPESEEGDQ